jgi:organic radical activating enzyme
MIQVHSITEQQQKLLKEGKILPVMEHFHTLQGEGTHSGKAAYFIRLGGCDVGCHWCDVKDSWDADKHPLTDMDEIAKLAAESGPMTVITGGEPSLWNLDFLTQKLREYGAKIHIETSGAHPLSGHLDWVTLSPKKLAHPQQEVLQKADELKCIIYNHDDFKFAEKYAALVRSDCRLFLQVEWSKREKMTAELIDYIKKNPQWQLSVQTHKYLDIP